MYTEEFVIDALDIKFLKPKLHETLVQTNELTTVYKIRNKWYITIDVCDKRIEQNMMIEYSPDKIKISYTYLNLNSYEIYSKRCIGSSVIDGSHFQEFLTGKLFYSEELYIKILQYLDYIIPLYDGIVENEKNKK